MQITAVHDTNILISAIVFGGSPRQCLELARQGHIEGVTCREILDELSETLAAKFDFTGQEIAETLADLLSFLSLIPISHQVTGVSVDPDDDRILDCGFTGNATHIVTGDKHLLTLKMYEGIVIVRAAEFLALAAK